MIIRSNIFLAILQELRRLERKVTKMAKTLRKLGYSDTEDDQEEGQEQGVNIQTQKLKMFSSTMDKNAYFQNMNLM